MYVLVFLIYVLLFLPTYGHAVNRTSQSLIPRAPHDPVIKKGDFVEIEEVQITQGFRDACKLANAALNVVCTLHQSVKNTQRAAFLLGIHR